MLRKTITTMLAMFVTAAAVFAGAGNALTVKAASDYENQNLLVNPDFEDAAAFSPAGTDHRGNWFVWQNAAKTTEDAKSGEGAVKFTGSDSALEQDVSGLIPGNTYVFSIWARLSESIDGAAQTHTIGVKNYGGTEVKRYVTSSEWTKFEIEFIYESGSPRVYGYVASHNGKDMYIDKASVVLKSDIKRASVKNGEMTVVFADTVTEQPELEATYSVGNGAANTITWTDTSWDAQTKTMVLKFAEIEPQGIEQKVRVNFSYQGVNVALDYTVEARKRTEAATFYVDSTNGSDANDGLSQESAFASIERLNAMTFIPGDVILFKKGETFTGCFKPMGSGNEEAPIKIASYGEGDARPVLQPGTDWTVEYIMSANAIEHNPKVNYVLQFYNVEYWEVSDLEIFDPNSEAYLTKGSDKYIGNAANDVYRSGITIQAEDIGTLEHFYIDNVVIHGFHGPGTNIGKTSGGITMNVITNKERDITRSVPTQINDIRVTNCEIYDVGRTGINFLTPWSFRTDEKWGPFDYGTRGYDYLPYEDFYMANNYIHDVDGDGTIIDNCANAVAEYNLVTRCCLRPATEGGGAAVGLFNWNSDDTIFQYNEVYDVRVGSGASASNDGQGIEIDALNDRTWVQYNYVHDNMGGFMMLCNVDDNYRSFDGIVRYNISQNDYAHPRQGLFDIYSANYGTQIYNNTFYLTERTLKDNQMFLFSAVDSYDTMKFYNNIFYYDGETPVAANTFGDNAIDWQSNIFYGITNLPANDNAGAPNMNVDPMVKNIGKGGTGEAADVVGAKQNKKIDWVDLSCYELKADSPAVNAGVLVENNGGRDYFGNPVAGIPDIGAYESGSVVLKVVSNNPEIVISQENKNISVMDNAKITAQKLLESLVLDKGVNVTVKRGDTVLEGGIRVAAGDEVTITYNGKKVSHTIVMVEDTLKNVIPVKCIEASAGSEETAQSKDYASNVLDNNVGTIWHTAWDGTADENKYLTLKVKDGYEYVMEGYVYTPRTDSQNGVIKAYEIYVSDDNATWTKVANGEWAADYTVKKVMFEEPVQARYVKLLAVSTEGNYASAAEARLLGKLVDTTAPTAPKVSVGTVTDNSVKLQWTKSEDDNEVTEYVLLKNGEVFAVFDSQVTSYVVNNLKENKSYKFAVYAVDGVGNKSVEGKISVKTNYSITYNLNGGSNNKKNPESYNRNSKTITLQAPTRKGYTFKGWYSNKKLTKKVTKIKAGSTGKVTLYAKWSAKEYDITYKLNGGKNNSKNPKEYTIKSSTITLKAPTRKGYTFKGWYSDKKFTKKVTKIKKGSIGKVTLYAKWSKK